MENYVINFVVYHQCLSGLVPYWAVFKIILMMINNAYTINSIMVYIFIVLIAYISQVCCFGASTMLSHITAYEILSEIRKKLAQKLMRLPFRRSGI